MSSTSRSLQSLSAQDGKTLLLAALGGALEFYDFIIFVFFAALLGELFFPSDLPEWLRQLQTFSLFAAGYLARPVGGAIMAHFGDKLGRKKMFSLSILLMAIPTLVMGLLPSYSQIGLFAPLLMLLMRVVQGAAIGGEVPGAWVFVAEHVPEHRVSLACGSLTAGLTVGILLGSLIAGGLTRHLDASALAAYGWRIAFILGGVFGLVAMFLRRWLQETPVFIAMEQQKTASVPLPIQQLLRSHKRALLGGVLLTWLLAAALVVMILMMPTLMQKLYGLSAASTLTANSWATLMLLIGCLVYGWLGDKFGAAYCLRRGVWLLVLASGGLFIALMYQPQWVLLSYGLVGFTVGVVALVPSLIVSAFPARVRFTGTSVAYNFSYALFGGLTPIILTLMLRLTPLAPVLYLALPGLLSVWVSYGMPKFAIASSVISHQARK